MSEHQIQLTTLDGQTLSFACDEGEDILSAAEKQDIYLIAQCHAGSCGACIAQCKEGEFHQGDYSNDALTDDDRTNGKALLCRTYPRSDMQIQLPYEHSLVRFEKTPIREAEIVNKTYLTEDTVKLDLQLLPDEDDNLSLDFEPGQFMEFFIPDTDEEKRAYSIANAPNWDGSLEFVIKLRPGGKFSTFLDKTAKPGMKLKLEGPSGLFTLRDNGLRPRYFVAGGCGLASIISMLRRMAEWQEPHPVHLFFGVWSDDEVFFEQEIKGLVTELPDFSYQVCVTQASENWHGYSGSVVSAFEETLKSAKITPDIYICGSPGLIDGVAEVTEPLGISRDDLIFERFAAKAEAMSDAVRCDIDLGTVQQ